MPIGQKRKPVARKKIKTLPGALRWWPFLVGIFLTPAAMQAMNATALSGPWGGRLVAPWALLLQSVNLHMSPIASDHVVQFAVYAQFPFYGLLMMVLQARHRILNSLMIIGAIHLAAFAILSAVATS
jgi:hypothetical protein